METDVIVIIKAHYLHFKLMMFQVAFVAFSDDQMNASRTTSCLELTSVYRHKAVGSVINNKAQN